MQESTNRTTNVFTTTTVTVHTHTSVRKTVGFIGCLCKRLTSVVHLLHNCQKSKTKLPKAVAVPLHRRQLLSKPTFYLCERPWVHLARLPRRQRRENSRLHRLGRDGTSTGGTVFRFRPRQLSLARLRRACTLGEKTRDGPWGRPRLQDYMTPMLRDWKTSWHARTPGEYGKNGDRGCENIHAARTNVNEETGGRGEARIAMARETLAIASNLLDEFEPLATWFES